MAYTKYSLTPANNTATPPDGAPEGMLPSAVNDTMRDMMAQIRDCGDGIRDGTYTMTAPKITGGTITGVALSGNTFTNPVITGGSINNTTIGGSTAAAGTFTSLSDSGNLTFTGTGNRITGDFSNATVANRVAFQTSTTNGSTTVSVLPNGTGTATSVSVFNNSDPTNASFFGLISTSTESRLNSNITGTGTYLPLTMYTGGSERLRIDTSGNVGIGTSSPSYRLDVVNSSATSITQIKGSNSSTTITSASVAGAALFLTNTNNTANNFTAIYGADAGENVTSGIAFINNSDANNEGTMAFMTRPSGGSLTERMRIDSSGNVLVGRTSVTGTNCRLNVQLAGTTASGYTAASNAGISLDAGTATNGVINLVGGAELGVYRSNSSGAYDVGIGFGDNSNRILRFDTAGAERMRITSAGRVGIGTSSPASLLHVASSDAQITCSNADASVYTYMLRDGFYSVGGRMDIYTGGANAQTFWTNANERMRITSGGDLFINTTASSGYGLAKLQIFTNLTVAGGQTIQDTATTYSTSSEYIVFTNSSGSRAGSIQHTAVTTVAYNTSSDARLKQDLGVATDTSVIDNTIIHNFKWIANQEDDVGVFAQEAHLVKPSAVSVGSDDLTEDGNLKQPWGVDYSKYVPDLIVYCQQLKKSIQEQQAMIEELKQEVALLKSK